MGEREVVFIDANIFLEFILEDEKSEKCDILLKNIKTNEINAMTSDFIVYTCLIQIQNKLKNIELLKDFILLIGSLNGLEIIRPYLTDIYNAIEIANKESLDFDDSLVVSCMKSANINKLVSFDKHFDKVKTINRIEP